MSKFSGGLLVGVLVTLAIVSLIDSFGTRQDTDTPSLASEDLAEDQPIQEPRQLKLRALIGDEPSDGTPALDEYPALEESDSQQALLHPDIASEARIDPDNRERVTVPEELKPLLRKPIEGSDEPKTMGDLHEELESEPRDESLSPYLEAQIQEYLSRQPTINEFSVLRIECRSSLCEIQAIGFGLEPAGTWVSMTNSMTNEPWFQFSGMSTSAESQDNQTILLTIMHRSSQ